MLVAGIAWLLFWTLMVLVAVEDYRRDGGGAPWQPVLWETSSALVATCLFLIQRRFSAQHDVLVATPWRWFAQQARWLPLYWFGFTPVVFALRHAVYALAGTSSTSSSQAGAPASALPTSGARRGQAAGRMLDSGWPSARGYPSPSSLA